MLELLPKWQKDIVFHTFVFKLHITIKNEVIVWKVIRIEHKYFVDVKK